jgi:fatty acid desaturase
MKAQSLSWIGCAWVVAPPALLAAAVGLDEPWLVLGTGMLVFPLARMLFGACRPDEAARLPPGVATLLDWLPRTYVGVLIAALGSLMFIWSGKPPAAASLPGWALSLWLTLVFGACVAHTLLHSRVPLDRRLGDLLAGVVGYPVLAYEHLRHHRLAGRTAAAEAPAVHESLWTFALRRLRRIGLETVGPGGMAWWGTSGSPGVRGLRIGLASSCVSLLLFAWAAGWPGVIVYLSAAGLTAFGMQLVTYLQHWGLGDDSFPDAARRQLSWEDDCRFSSWITMGLSLHQAHHDSPALPYHRLRLAKAAPRLPVGYALLMFAAAVPPIWRRVMQPALAFWREQGESPPSAGRRVTCVAVYRTAKPAQNS